ncbi:MAG TPA: TAXI family TRAP transporter solute-binding subunit [Candidatus Binatia bacterium]|nr:TAXI family TRAP transporter solute-binding subunit [Candidatus Binatia bacterium]
MKKTFHLKFATTGVMRAEIASRIALAFYETLRGTASKVSLILGSSDSDLGGTGAALSIGAKKYDLAFANPASLARMAVLGKGFYKKKIPLRAIGVFPSWDRLVFAVHEKTGIRSLEELKEKRYPLRVSTRIGGKYHSTLFAIDEALQAYGFSFADIEKWGGKVLRADSPSSKQRKAHIENGAIDAVFDEGLKSWGSLALNSGMRLLPISDTVLRRLEKIGYTRAAVTLNYYPELDQPIETLDFSGWLLFCHADLPNFLAYEVAAKIEGSYNSIPVDHFDGRPMTMHEFCNGGEAGPLAIPLHPGAKKYFKEKSYL